LIFFLSLLIVTSASGGILANFSYVFLFV